MLFDFTTLIRRLFICASCWLFDSFLLYLSSGGVAPRTIGVVIYRWCLYTRSNLDLKILFAIGLVYDVFFILPLGVNGFSFAVIYLLGQSQARYLRTSHQYTRWVIFIVFLIILIQLESVIMSALGRLIAINSSVIYSILITFAIYPLMFKSLQHYD